MARQYVRKKIAHIDMRVEPEIIAEIDAWRKRQRVYVSRTAAILYMVRQYLDNEASGNWPNLL